MPLVSLLPKTQKTSTFLMFSGGIERDQYSMKCVNLKMWKKRKLLMVVKKRPPKVFYKKVFLKISQNSQENTCVGVSVLVKFRASSCNYIKKVKNTFFTEHLQATASVCSKLPTSFSVQSL